MTRRLAQETWWASSVGMADRSNALRACHSLAGSSVSRNCTSPPASSATGMPSR